MEPLLRIAVSAARSAGTYINRAARDVDLIKVEQKRSNDYVTEVDRRAEELIVREIRASYPDHRMIGEELGSTGPEQAEVEWIIDPLDGTTNFLRGIPQYAISIACRVRGRLEHAVVYDPVKNEEFTASRGRGAKLGERRIRVTDRKGLQGALIATGIPFNEPGLSRLDGYLATMNDLLGRNTAGIRRAGAASLDLAWVAAGRMDGFWEMNLKPWDIAAGVLIAREAGALVSDLAGGEKFLDSGDILCAAPKVFREMLPIVSKHLKR